MTTDEMRLLLEAFALEAGDHVTELKRTLDKLERSPNNTANWRKAVASFRIVADSAVMMELPDVQLLARLGQEACQFMADHSDRQQNEAIKPIMDGAAALGQFLTSLVNNAPDRSALDEGQAAFATWHHLVNVGSAPAVGSLPELADVVAPTPERLPRIEPVVDQPEASAIVQPPVAAPTAPSPAIETPVAAAPTPPPVETVPPVIEVTPPVAAAPPAIDQVIDERPATPAPSPSRPIDEVVVRPEPPVVQPSMPATPAIDQLLAEQPVEGASIAPSSETPAEPLARLARWRRVLPRRSAEQPATDETSEAEPRAVSPSMPEQSAPEAPSSTRTTTAPSEPPSDEVAVIEPVASVAASDVIDEPVLDVAAPIAAVSDLVDEPATPEAPVEPADVVIDTAAVAEADVDELDISDELLEIFVDEVGEHLAALDEQMVILQEAPSDEGALREARRSLHTLKGAAGMIGVGPIQRLCLISEETVEQYLDAGMTASLPLLDLIKETVEALRQSRDSIFDRDSLRYCETVTVRWHALERLVLPEDAVDSDEAATDTTVDYDLSSAELTEPMAVAEPATELMAETVELAEPSVAMDEAIAEIAAAEIAAPVAEVTEVTVPVSAADEAAPELVAPVAETGEPVVEADVLLSEPVVELVAELSELVVEPVAELSEPVAEPVAELVDELVDVGSELVEPVVEQPAMVIEAIAPDADQVVAVEPVTAEPVINAVPTAEMVAPLAELEAPTGEDVLLQAPTLLEPADALSMDVVPALEPAAPAPATPTEVDELVAAAEPVIIDEPAEPVIEGEDRLLSQSATAAAAASEQDQLQSIFASEAEEGLQQVDELMTQLKPGSTDTDNKTALRELLRQVHTLKGAAAMMGQEHFTGLAHRMEDLLDQLNVGGLPLTPAVVGLLYDTVEALRTMSVNRTEVAANTLTTRYTAALSAAQATRLAAGAATPATAPSPSSVGPVVRLEIEQLNELMGLAEELVTNRAGFEEQLALMAGLLRDFERSVERLARVGRSLEYDYEAWGVAAERPVVEDDEFDTLEFDRYTEFARLTGEMTEAVADARTISRDIGARMTSLNALVGRQGRVVTSMRERMERARLISLNGLIPVARRLVYQTALFESKQVEVDTRTLDLPVDRTIYDAVSTALGHILRNAIAHGIEGADERQAVGKPAGGRITIEGRQAQYETIVVIHDDGRGIDRDKVRRTAEAEGWLRPGQELSDEETLNLIFRPGLSTSESIDQVAGRGVGMDAALSAISSVRGRIEVESTPGKGTTFTLHLPLMMTVADVLLVECSKYRLALPMTWLGGTLRVDPKDLRSTPSGYELEVGGEWLPTLPLAELLGWPVDLNEHSKWPAVIAQAGEQRIVLLTDALIQRQELAISSLGPSFGWLRSVQGASVLGNGQVAPVLDLIELIERGRALTQTARVETRAVRVLVCDDSVSVRRVVSMALERQGWEVVQARNGHEALAAMAAGPIDLALLDIEMPQMDGYALLERLRSDDHYSHIPVAMLTSRGAEKHRQHAFDLGAQAYLIKPYKEDFLLTTLRRLLEGQREISSELTAKTERKTPTKR